MSAVFDCLGFVFEVRATDPALQGLVEELYAPFASSEAPTVGYDIISWVGDTPAGHAVYANHDLVRTTYDPTIALAHLVWEISQRVMQRPTPLLLLHAAAAELDGHAVLLPAPSGRGKSTLVAGLVSSGLGYLTDDVAAIEPDTLMMAPYPKPLSVARGLWSLFPQLPPVPPAVDRFLGDEGFLTHGDLGGVLGVRSVPRLVVAPSYTEGAGTSLQEFSRAECVILLAEQSFNVRTLGGGALTLLSSLVGRCRCFRLAYGDLQAAVEVVVEQLAMASRPSSAQRS